MHRPACRFAALLALLLLAGCASSARGPGAAHARAERGRWTEQVSGTTASLRGVSAISSEVAWASGTDGTWLRTIDGGRTWQGGVVPGAEELDLRDVEAFSATTALVMAAGEPARILRTTDGGESWELVFEDRSPGVFLNAIAFRGAQRGIAFGDPIEGRPYVLLTDDGGRTWAPIDPARLPPPTPDERGFAASGSCVALGGVGHAWVGTGGTTPRVWRTTDAAVTWIATAAPMASGPGAGIFSIVFTDERHGIAVGGDHLDPGRRDGTACVTSDGGKSWRAAAIPPGGYRSVVVALPGGDVPIALALGPGGADVSADGGRVWYPFPGGSGWHAAATAPGTSSGWAVGANGRITRFDLPAR